VWNTSSSVLEVQISLKAGAKKRWVIVILLSFFDSCFPERRKVLFGQRQTILNLCLRAPFQWVNICLIISAVSCVP
jgi:hypothetical protein